MAVNAAVVRASLAGCPLPVTDCALVAALTATSAAISQALCSHVRRDLVAECCAMG